MLVIAFALIVVVLVVALTAPILAAALVMMLVMSHLAPSFLPWSRKGRRGGTMVSPVYTV